MNKMHLNLRAVLYQMLFMSDEQVLYDEVDKINFKKEGWYKEYHWTEKQEEQFMKWMSEYLKKNWEGITDHRPMSKQTRDKAVDEFIMNYGCVRRPLNISDFTPTVSWAHLDEVMGKEERKEFNNFMFGQTTPLHGVYKSDLSRWLAHLPCID